MALDLFTAGDNRLDEPGFIYRPNDPVLGSALVDPSTGILDTTVARELPRPSPQPYPEQLLGAAGRTPIENTNEVVDTFGLRNTFLTAAATSINDSWMGKGDTEDPIWGKEIPQAIRTDPERIPLFVEMLDSDLKRQGIYIAGKYLVTTLKLNPNPESMTINSTKKINRYFTMTRWVEEHWGDEIDNISMNGSTFSFFGMDTDQGSVGLTSAYRDETPAYEYLKELVKFYQLNGCVYQGDSDYEGPGHLSVIDFLNEDTRFKGNHPRKGMIKERLYIRLNFDYMAFIGRFESFDIIEDSASPFRFMYNIIFKAERTEYKLDKLPDTAGTEAATEVKTPRQRIDDTIAASTVSEDPFRRA